MCCCMKREARWQMANANETHYGFYFITNSLINIDIINIIIITITVITVTLITIIVVRVRRAADTYIHQ